MLPVSYAFLTLLDEVQVSAQQRGMLTAVDVREGQSVQQGERLAQVDDRQVRMACERADIELRRARRDAENRWAVELARKTLELATLELRRATTSNERVPQSVSPSELEARRLAVERAQLQLEQAEFELATAQLQVALRENELEAAQQEVHQRQVLAPITGVVVELKRRRGEWVEPGQPVPRLVRMDRLRAEGLLDARHLRGDLCGRPVQLGVSLGVDQAVVLRGVVTFVSPEIEPVGNQVRVWAEVENSDMVLRPGMRVEMNIELQVQR
jgi:macrolide-specific efflux system membrane fusion protein